MLVVCGKIDALPDELAGISVLLLLLSYVFLSSLDLSYAKVYQP